MAKHYAAVVLQNGQANQGGDVLWLLKIHDEVHRSVHEWMIQYE